VVWGKTSDRDEHRERSKALTAAYHGPAGLPISESRRRELGQTGRRAGAEGRTGSRGGAPIWVMREAWMAERHRKECKCPPVEHRGRTLLTDSLDGATDPDGFAVFGRYPNGFLAHVLKTRLLGDVARDEVLHVCSGTLSASERWTVDLRPEAQPTVQASGTALPFRDGSFAAVMLDPPYSDEYARNLYRVENPRPSWLLKEAARVVRPGGRVGMLHVAIPFSPPDCHLVNVWGISTGVGFRIRAFTVYEKAQTGLFL
jgi:hypothetical protein